LFATCLMELIALIIVVVGLGANAIVNDDTESTTPAPGQ
jgi:hypothetical protein